MDGDKLYGLPIGGNSKGFYYNKDFCQVQYRRTASLSQGEDQRLFLQQPAHLARLLGGQGAAGGRGRLRPHPDEIRPHEQADLSIVLIGMLIPGNVLFIAEYILVMKAHILNTHWALLLPYTAGALPMSILLIAAFMRNMPLELDEAAIIDGLSVIDLFARIVLPFTVPALVAVLIINNLGN